MVSQLQIDQCSQKLELIDFLTVFAKLHDFMKVPTFEWIDQFSIVIPFSHLEFNFQQNISWWRDDISPTGDFGGFGRLLWLFSAQDGIRQPNQI